MKLNTSFLIKIILIKIILLISANAFSLEKRPYHIILVLGADFNVSNGNDPIVPLLYTSFIYYYDNLSMYTELVSTTSMVYFDTGYQKDGITVGFKPIFGYTAYGGYTAFIDGDNKEVHTLKGQFVALETYFKYTVAKIFSAKLIYQPSYFFYWKYKKKGSLDAYDSTMDLPDDHWENLLSLDLKLDMVKKIDDLDLVKHGFLLQFLYQYMNREGYGSFYDPLGGEISNIKNSHKMYLMLGGYYNFPKNFTLKLDFLGAWHEDVDRNNADQIGGSFGFTNHPAIPGFYVAEFYHGRFITCSFNVGLPANVWELRFEPGFTMLYMAKENPVVGVPDYKEEVYMSVSLGISMKIANLVPLFVKYAYGINARRKGEIGNHEISFALAAGFLKTDNKKENK